MTPTTPKSPVDTIREAVALVWQELDAISGLPTYAFTSAERARRIDNARGQLVGLSAALSYLSTQPAQTDDEIRQAAEVFLDEPPGVRDFPTNDTALVDIMVRFARSLSLPRQKGEVEWIPVSERLPENNEAVLVVTRDGGIFMAEYEENLYWLIAGLGAEDSDYPVIYWMPLPAVPK